MSGLSAVTDNGFLPLMKSSDSGLVDIDLNNCENLTDAVVSALVKAMTLPLPPRFRGMHQDH
jgi:EIN3-binding F-box protein